MGGKKLADHITDLRPELEPGIVTVALEGQQLRAGSQTPEEVAFEASVRPRNWFLASLSHSDRGGLVQVRIFGPTMRIQLVALATLFCVGCGGNSVTAPTATVPVPDPGPDLRALIADAGVTPVAPPAAPDPAKVELGRLLMFDKILSGNMDISCATCHHPFVESGDGLSLSFGTGGTGLGPARQLGAGRPLVARNATPLFNLASVPVMFWDGRVHGTEGVDLVSPAKEQLPAGFDSTLAVQAMFPVTGHDEMRGFKGDLRVDGLANEICDLADSDFTGIWAALTARLQANPEYVARFQAVFPGQPVSYQNAANAIAAFEIAGFTRLNSPFDHYLAGDDSALTEAQKRGALLFFGDAKCSQFHNGPLLSDFQFHDVAVPQVGLGKGVEGPLDFGRGRDSGVQEDRFKFRTSPLRNVAVTGPWTHAGGFTTLEAVVRHYTDPARSLQEYDVSQLAPDLQSRVHIQDSIAAGELDNLDPILQETFTLTDDQVADIVAFLEALTDATPLQDPPDSVPSGLPVGD